MDTFEAIRTLRAVRAFRDEPVPDEIVRRIVEAGRLTASATNRQPWHFIVVRDKDMLRQLGALMSTPAPISRRPRSPWSCYRGERLRRSPTAAARSSPCSSPRGPKGSARTGSASTSRRSKRRSASPTISLCWQFCRLAIQPSQSPERTRSASPSARSPAASASASPSSDFARFPPLDGR